MNKNIDHFNPNCIVTIFFYVKLGHNGRIDSLGLDENGCHVIIEYKRYTDQNIINQGLFYLNWLLDHKAEFQLLVMKKIGNDAAEKIEWNGTRVVCIAADFTKYDEHAVMQINRSIELLRYKLFEKDILLLELVNAVSVDEAPLLKGDKRTHADQMATAPAALLALFEKIRCYIQAQGDDVQEKSLKLYTAFKRLSNFICITLTAKQDPCIRMWLKLDLNTVTLEEGFARDVSKVGHWGTGDLEIVIRTPADFEKARLLIERSYQEN